MFMLPRSLAKDEGSSCRMRISAELLNTITASLVLLLIYGTTTAAFDLLNASLDDSNTTLDSKVGYECSSLFTFTSIAGSFVVPFLQCLGDKVVIAGSTLFHLPLYLAMIFLDRYALLSGAVVTGVADGVVWVALFGYVTSISQKQNVERNLSYFIFIYSFAGLLGNLLNYISLDNATKITDTARTHIYGACAGLTVLSSLLSLFGLRRMPPMLQSDRTDTSARQGLLSESDEEDNFDRPAVTDERDLLQRQGLPARLYKFLLKPASIAQALTSIVSGLYDAWIVIICTCIRNTYGDRHLIAAFGLIYGCCKILFSGSWNKMTKTFGYRAIIYVVTLVTGLWLAVILVIFPPVSVHDSSTSGPSALFPQGPWVIYLLGLLTGVSRTCMDLLKQISAGTCSRADDVMEGFKPSVMFTLKTIIWSGASAVTYAVVPYVNLYVLVSVSGVGLVVNHFLFVGVLLNYFQNV